MRADRADRADRAHRSAGSDSEAEPAADSEVASGAVATAASTAVLDLTVVVPAYNEERRLRPTLDAIRAYLCADPERWGDWELIVVDDGSTDGTAGIAEDVAAAEPRVRLLTGAPGDTADGAGGADGADGAGGADGGNHGKGHALRRGVLASRGRRVLLTDADLATPIAELGLLDTRLTEEGGSGAAIGSRAHPDARIEVHQRKAREWLGRLGNALIRLVAVKGISDTQCGFKLFDGDQARAAFADSRLDGWGIDVEILRFFRRSDWQVTEVPVRWAHQAGSKVRPLDYLGVLLELVRLRARLAPRGRVHRGDLAVLGVFLLGSVLLYKGLWTDLDHAYLADSGADQNQWEWFFAVTADNVHHLRNPLFTTLQNFPDGVNLMANTVMLGLSVPLTPLTLTLGPNVTWALVLTLGLAATAGTWYRLFLRRLVSDRRAAAAGAALAAFAPPMMSHANAHPNFVVLFMIPLIIDRALTLCQRGLGDEAERGRSVARDGTVLGLLLTYQIFLGEEPLLLAVVGMLLFAVFYAVVRPARARAALWPLVRGLAYAAQIAVPLLVFPLYWQFLGPQSYHSVLHGTNAGNSPLSFLQFSGRALLGDETTADRLAMNRTEQNAFYGWPLIAAAFGMLVWLWRLAVVRVLALTAVAAAVLSMGAKIRLPYTHVVVPGPWRLLAHQPLFESVIESRVGMICAPALGALLALTVDRLLVRASGGEPSLGRPTRIVGLVALAAALIPIVPTPMPVRERTEVPAFIADGTYRSYISKGQSVLPVPLPMPGSADALSWQSASVTGQGIGFPLPGGYFNGPWGPHRMGIYGAAPRYTSNLFMDVRNSGQVPEINANWKAQARYDFAFWKAGVVVLAPQPNDAALYDVLQKLIGRPGKRVGGAWIWDLPG